MVRWFLGNLLSLAAMALPLELVFLEAGRLDLRRKLEVVGWLAVPKAVFWLGFGTLAFAAKRGSFGAVILVAVAAQLAVSFTALSRRGVRGARLIVTMLLLLFALASAYIARALWEIGGFPAQH